MPPSFHEARWRHGLLLLSTAAGIRAFCIGLTGVLLGLYLARRGLTAGQLGLVVGCGLAGNAVATAWLALAAPRVNRRAVLLVSTVLGGAGLIGAGNVSAPLAIAVVAFVGMVNGMGRDRGPAQVLEQVCSATGSPCRTVPGSWCGTPQHRMCAPPLVALLLRSPTSCLAIPPRLHGCYSSLPGSVLSCLSRSMPGLCRLRPALTRPRSIVHKSLPGPDVGYAD